MGRFLRNNLLWISGVTAAVGLVLTVIAWMLAYFDTPYLNWYRAILSPVNKWMDGASGTTNTDFNLILMVVAPIVLLSGAWYLGEQIADRRRFERLMETDKKSDFARNRKELEELARDLPDSYRQRIKERERLFTGAR
ncbi:MAG: DUF3198 domain-containing protein [Thermoplasmatota archaeon]